MNKSISHDVRQLATIFQVQFDTTPMAGSLHIDVEPRISPMHSPFLIAIMIAFSSGRLVAALSFGSTPEWLAHKASLSFVGVPQRVVVSHLMGDRWLTTVQFRIDRRIKGPLSAGDLVTVTSIDDKGRTDQMDLNGAVGKKRNVLVLATIAENTSPETDGRYIFLPHFWNCPVFYADEQVKWVYTEAGDAIRTYSEVLKRIVSQSIKEADLIGRYWPGKIVRREIIAEWGTDAEKELYAASAVLIVSLEYVEYKESMKEEPQSKTQDEPDSGANRRSTSVPKTDTKPADGTPQHSTTTRRIAA